MVANRSKILHYGVEKHILFHVYGYYSERNTAAKRLIRKCVTELEAITLSNLLNARMQRHKANQL